MSHREDDMRGEQSADPLDRASSESIMSNAEALRQHAERLRDAMPGPSEDGGCVDCDEPVEPGRLRVGLGRCLSCQQDFERMEARRLGAASGRLR